MRRVRIGPVAAMVALAVMVALAMAGCGDSAGETTDTTATTTGATAATETSATQSTSTDTSTTQISPTGTSTPPAAGDDGSWTTIATLRSTDPAWQGIEGIIVSEPLSVTGDIRLVLDMPDAGAVDGLIVALIPAGSFTDPSSLMDAIQSGDATMVTLAAQLGPKTVSGLEGEYVLVNSVPTDKPWSVEVQSRQ